MGKFILSAFADEISPDLKTQMDVLEQNEIEYIEMRGVNGKGLVSYSLDEVKKIKEELDKRGFKISAIGSPLGKIHITDPFEDHLKLMRHTLEIAKILETRYIRMFSFFMPRGEDPAKYRDEVMARWRAFLDEAEGTGIMLLHENEKDIYGDIPERCLDLVNELESENFKLILDPANFIQCGVNPYPDAYEMLKEHIVYLHIKDALHSNHQVVPAGQGDGRIKELLTDLYNRGFEGFLSLEPHLAFFAGLSSLELDDKWKNLPEGGPRTFTIASEALKKIISEIERQ